MKDKLTDLINKIDNENKELFDNAGDVPKYLYKYRSTKSEYPFSELENDKLWLSTPFDFNDPFDCMLYIDTEEVSRFFLDSKMKVPDYLDGKLKRERGEKDSYNYWGKYNLINVADNMHSYLQNGIGVISLSELNNSPLMWSHYADGHSGYVVRYRIDKPFRDFHCYSCDTNCYKENLPIFPVIYDNKRYNATNYSIIRTVLDELGLKFEDYFGIGIEKIIAPIHSVLQKSEDWSYEKEWRIVCNNLCNEFFFLKPDAIVVGAKATFGTWKKLIGYAQRKSIPIYMEIIDCQENGVKIQEVPKDSIQSILESKNNDDEILYSIG